MAADEVVTQCAIQVLRRAGRQISSLTGFPFKSEREAVLALELNNVKELLVRTRRCSLEKALLGGEVRRGRTLT
jgi:hypothetical protein